MARERIIDDREDDRHSPGRLQQRSYGRCATRENDIGCEGNQFRCVSAKLSAICCAPTGFDPHIPINGPTELRQGVQERVVAGLPFRIVYRRGQ
jgi:hypothetical protein